MRSLFLGWRFPVFRSNEATSQMGARQRRLRRADQRTLTGAVPRPGQRLPAALDRWLAQVIRSGAAPGVDKTLLVTRSERRGGGDRLRVRAMALPWQHGLESAMLAHFSADLVLHVVAPLAFG